MGTGVLAVTISPLRGYRLDRNAMGELTTGAHLRGFRIFRIQLGTRRIFRGSQNSALSDRLSSILSVSFRAGLSLSARSGIFTSYKQTRAGN